MSASKDKSEQALQPDAKLPEPYIDANGTLVIPFNSDPKYHWWKQGGQALAKTLQALRPTPAPQPGEQPPH